MMAGMPRRAWPGPLLLVLAVAACAPRESPDPVILELDGVEVHRSAFLAYLHAIETRGEAALEPQARAGLLDAYLEERALVIEARAHKLVPEGASPEDEARAVARLLASQVDTPAVSEAQIREYYGQHEKELAQPVRVGLSQILVGTLNEARDVKRRLARNDRAFDAIARKQSKGPEAEQGGYMGVFEPGQLPPELEAAAFSLSPGRTSNPIQSPLGYHVLRVDSRQDARVPSFEEARQEIQQRLARERRREAERAYVAGLLARSKVNHAAALRTPAP
jgi:peptidyl-prolyl cis-trans isomerase C